MTRRRALLPALLLAVSLAPAACTRLPEPDSPGAKLYAERCDGPCHRLYAPGSMKYEMWKIVVDRMQGELARRGLPTLNADEEKLLLDYLRRHSEGTAAR